MVTVSGAVGGVARAVTDVHLGQPWEAHAVFRADRRGTVDLDSAAPLYGGSYAAADGMGLFWAVDPVGKPAGQAAFIPAFPEVRSSFEVRITVAAHGRKLGARTLTRRWTADGVTTRALAVTADHVAGQLFVPPPGTPVRSAVLAFGGSEAATARSTRPRCSPRTAIRPSPSRTSRSPGCRRPCTTFRSSTFGRPRTCSPRSPS
nr:acyl-CoA thioesterase/BAAT N-terminal domain-containing protein [Streptomyces sp. TLI_235]